MTKQRSSLYRVWVSEQGSTKFVSRFTRKSEALAYAGDLLAQPERYEVHIQSEEEK